ncbi:MAG TPA: gamma-glutamyltransferase [Alphaproteobacteria bacterium]|nr:gamma-glutamyltransferase [Alphaproteobacteria bacterium]
MKALFRRFSALAVLLGALAVLPQPGFAASPSGPVRATKDMAVTANPYATKAAMKILHQGGNAVDAAIAAQFVLSLVEPQSSGVGGGAFMLYYQASDAPGVGSQITSYEGREVAPKAAGPDLFLDANGKPRSFFDVGIGGRAVGVPGAMKMLYMAHQDHGLLPWADLFGPAIELAEKGFVVSPRLHGELQRFRNFAKAASFKKYFYDDKGNPWPAGHVLKNPAYVQTLKLLQAKGVEPLYSGKLAREIVAAVHDTPLPKGLLTMEDMKNYKAHKTAPLCMPYHQWKVCGPQLPTSGGVTMLETLGLLRDFNLQNMKDKPIERIHLVSEAMRLAYADRNYYLGDPNFVKAPVAGLLNPTYLRDRSKLISLDKTMAKAEPGTPPEIHGWNYAPDQATEGPSTSHLSITDQWGNAISMTTTVQGPFGSQLMVGGFILNNQLTDFSFAPTMNGKPVANRVQGGKHPLSSMAPTMVVDKKDRLHLVIGSPGGRTIIAYVTQAVLGVLDFGRNIQQAVSAPHFFGRGTTLIVENGSVLGHYVGQFEKLGHTLSERRFNSGLHGIEIDGDGADRVLWGGVDPRREGLALGDDN